MMNLDPRLPDEQKARFLHRHGYLREAASLLPYREGAKILFDAGDIPGLVTRAYRWYEGGEHPCYTGPKGISWIHLGNHPDDEGDIMWAMSQVYGHRSTEVGKWGAHMRLGLTEWGLGSLSLSWGPYEADCWLRSCCSRLDVLCQKNPHYLDNLTSPSRNFLRWYQQNIPFPEKKNRFGSRAFGATRMAQDIALLPLRNKGLHALHPELQKERTEALYRERRWQGLQMLSIMAGGEVRP